jgi:catechol 2,3-dioxygenase-like lactoylglutathione lyase family enzyme
LDRRGSYSPFAGLPLQDRDERRIPLGQAREFAELWQADCNVPLLGSVEFGPKDDVMPEKSNGPPHDRALAFYTEKLGFRLVTDQQFRDEQRWIELQDLNEIEFSLAFVTKQIEVDALGKTIARKAKGDAVVWFAYPKGTSQRYKSEVSRDTGWQVLGSLGFEGVRSVAIDEDWSAARFRRVEFIKAKNREQKHAMTTQGKAPIAGKRHQ